MSDQGLFIRLSVQPNRDSLARLEALLRAGWRPDDHGLIRFLPLGDDGDYSWRQAPAGDLAHVMNEVREKEERAETVGIVLTFEDTMIGGEWLFFPGDEVVFTPSLNRRVSGNHSDVGWYLERVLAAFDDGEGLQVESWRWEESV